MRTLLTATVFMLVASGCVHSSGPSIVQDPGSKSASITYFNRFVIQGTAVSADDQVPVGHVEIVFIDTGLDSYRAGHNWETRIGTANISGVIDQGLGYGWCKEVSFNSLGVAPPDLSGVDPDEHHTVIFDALMEASGNVKRPETFAVEMRKAGYKSYRVNFDRSELTDQQGTFVLNLGTVTLERAAETASTP